MTKGNTFMTPEQMEEMERKVGAIRLAIASGFTKDESSIDVEATNALKDLPQREVKDVIYDPEELDDFINMPDKQFHEKYNG